MLFTVLEMTFVPTAILERPNTLAMRTTLYLIIGLVMISIVKVLLRKFHVSFVISCVRVIVNTAVLSVESTGAYCILTVDGLCDGSVLFTTILEFRHAVSLMVAKFTDRYVCLD